MTLQHDILRLPNSHEKELWGDHLIHIRGRQVQPLVRFCYLEVDYKIMDESTARDFLARHGGEYKAIVIPKT